VGDDGAVTVRDGGWTVATGLHAAALATLLTRGGVRCEVVHDVDFQRRSTVRATVTQLRQGQGSSY
jgi:hypothetical protein